MERLFFSFNRSLCEEKSQNRIKIARVLMRKRVSNKQLIIRKNMEEYVLIKNRVDICICKYWCNYKKNFIQRDGEVDQYKLFRL